ncbi:hypothetical protein VKT23_012493 [Stygiomarasmius scandens]|uniref:Ricin B lectin domain-containing protein n=1 Tax=Marasmiellus scandens TaxID=2682957 RepID=A0ABR1J9Z2_9AGAR
MPKRIIQPLDTGRYFIINVKLQTFARLPDANISSEIVSSINKEDPGTKWNVHLLSNGKFTLQNFDFGLYAIREPSAGRGENATGGTLGQQWNIQEVKKPGHFV